MPTLVLDPQIAQQLLAERRAWGGDRFDEVWDGVYVLSPLANNEHQELIGALSAAFRAALAGVSGARVFPGINVSDRNEGWEQNYRCPDVAVVLPGSRAMDCGAHYCGGPDFVVEIVSDFDRSRDKFDFYAQVGVREFLIVNRSPWQLELYRWQRGKLKLVGTSAAETPLPLVSRVLPLTLTLESRPDARPEISLANPATGEQWRA